MLEWAWNHVTGDQILVAVVSIILLIILLRTAIRLNEMGDFDLYKRYYRRLKYRRTMRRAQRKS